MDHIHLSVSILGLIGLLMLVSLLLPLANRLKFPFTVLLAAVGIVLGVIIELAGEHPGAWILGDFLTGIEGLGVTSDIILFVFLPTLIFGSALEIDVRRLLDDIAPILVLAVVGLLISLTVVGYTLYGISDIDLVGCLLLGAIVSATDPVAVVALFRDLGAPKRLAYLVEGESLFNDATAIVLFTILSAMVVSGQDADFLSGAGNFVVVFLGGIAVGLVVGYAFCWVIGRMRNLPLVEVTLTLVLAYLVFILGEHYLHVSGVMAVVTAALVLGSYGRTQVSPASWHLMEDVWEQLGFWANSLIFVLVGVLVPSILSHVGWAEIGILAVLTVVAIGVRFATIFTFVPILAGLRLSAPVSVGYRAVMWWGGLRGAVSLALALIILEAPGIDPEIKSFIGVMVTGFVLFTLFINAPTMGPLIRLFGYDQLSEADVAVRDRALQQGLDRINARVRVLAQDNQIEDQLADTIADEYGARVAAVENEIKSLGAVSTEDWTYIGLTALVTRERRLYLRGFEDGVVAPKIARNLFAQADNIADAVKVGRVEGYRSAYKRTLDFPLEFRIAMFAHRHLGIDRLLGHRLADRIELLLSTRTVLRRLTERDLPRTQALVGEDAGVALKTLLSERAAATQQALEALSLQYPDYSKDLETAFLRRIALRLEEGEYRAMAEEALISQDVYNDLEQDMDARRRQMEARPRLDLGLDPEKLVAKVPFLADEPPAMILEIAALLKPIVVVPGEKVVRRGNAGDAMYFISSGAVEVGLDPDPVTIGSGDFFGELALLTDKPRTADVTALCFCNMLALYRGDFTRLLERNEMLRDNINRVARERLGETPA
jgi:CPA1 family monovalent cation:H+ antiporter